MVCVSSTDLVCLCATPFQWRVNERRENLIKLKINNEYFRCSASFPRHTRARSTTDLTTVAASLGPWLPSTTDLTTVAASLGPWLPLVARLNVINTNAQAGRSRNKDPPESTMGRWPGRDSVKCGTPLMLPLHSAASLRICPPPPPQRPPIFLLHAASAAGSTVGHTLGVWAQGHCRELHASRGAKGARAHHGRHCRTHLLCQVI